MRTLNNFWGLFDIFRRKFNPRTQAAGEGKHTKGRQHPANYRRDLKRKRKAERQHRRRVQLQAKGKKHAFKGRV